VPGNCRKSVRTSTLLSYSSLLAHRWLVKQADRTQGVHSTTKVLRGRSAVKVHTGWVQGRARQASWTSPLLGRTLRPTGDCGCGCCCCCRPRSSMMIKRSVAKAECLSARPPLQSAWYGLAWTATNNTRTLHAADRAVSVCQYDIFTSLSVYRLPAHQNMSSPASTTHQASRRLYLLLHTTILAKRRTTL